MEYHSLTSKQKGGVGEALLTAHMTHSTDIIVEWVREDLVANLDADLGEISVEHDHRVETYYINQRGTHMSWTPDCLLTAYTSRAYGPLRSSGDIRVDYPIEVKTGEYAELERNQREVMQLLATESNIVPVLATVDLDPLPSTYGVEFDRIAPPAGGTS